MKTIHALALVLSLALVLMAGCTSPTATPTPMPTATPTVGPTITTTPVSSTVPNSPVFMPEQTTNGRNYTAPSVTAIANASNGGISTGELGRQH